jgi:hypothetical protein
MNKPVKLPTHPILAETELCGYEYKLSFQTKLIELGVVMGNSPLLSSQHNSASSAVDQKGVAQHQRRSGTFSR